MVPITEDLKELMLLTDLFLVDIKHIDPIKSKELVGCSNEMELEFIRYLNKQEKKIWIRYVLIPGITDSKEDLLKLKEFISTLDFVEKVELLPYHNLGEHKWENLGFTYELKGIREAHTGDVERAKEILE